MEVCEMAAVPVVVAAAPSTDMVIEVGLVKPVTVVPAAMSVPVIVKPTSAEVKFPAVQVSVLDVVLTVQPVALAVCIAQSLFDPGLQNSVTGDGQGNAEVRLVT